MQQFPRSVVRRGDLAVVVQHDNAKVTQVDFDRAADRTMCHRFVNPHKPGLCRRSTPRRLEPQIGYYPPSPLVRHLAAATFHRNEDSPISRL
jgi:hypothetical protein